MIFGYRVEDQAEKHGMWRNFDGTWNPVFDQLSLLTQNRFQILRSFLLETILLNNEK